jgi:hypothetical protein
MNIDNKTLIYLLALATIVMIILASCSPKSYSGIVYNCSNDTVMCEGGKFKILDGSKPCGKMATFRPTKNKTKVNCKRLK